MDIVVRITVIYLFILVGMRILGKREFGQLSPFELVTLLIIPEIVSEALTDNDRSLTAAVIGTTTLLLLVFITSTIAHVSRKADDVLGGVPAVLIHDGQFLEDAMNRERITMTEISNEMHKAGLETLEQIKWAILEPDGKIAFITHEQETLPRKPQEERVVG
ncbi:MAG: DUF421 domain-containing protein [Chloroflexota bacterium]|nr:DUF421 domain-containing protein [Chloroflexota bacterium]